MFTAKYVILLILLFFITGCGLQSNWTLPTLTAPPTPHPTSTLIPLPDLEIISVEVNTLEAKVCYYEETDLETSVVIQNTGSGPAGSFVIAYNEEQHLVVEELAAGGRVTLTLPGFVANVRIAADAENTVLEADENNNEIEKRLTKPTQPVECYPTALPDPIMIEEAVELIGHTGKIWDIEYASDGRLIASGSVDNTLRLWQTRLPGLLRTMEGHPFPILTVSFAPNGLSIATGSDDGLIRIWQVSNGNLQGTLAGHAGWINDIAFSPDGLYLASASDDFTVRIWHMASGEAVKLIDEGMARVLAIAFSPDGKLLAWGESDGKVRVWDFEKQIWVHQFQDTRSAINSIAFSLDGSSLVTGSDDGLVRLWDYRNGEKVRTYAGHSAAVLSVAFSPQGEYLASAGADNAIHLRKMNEQGEFSSHPTEILSGHSGPVNSIHFSPDGSLLASASSDTTLRLWGITAVE